MATKRTTGAAAPTAAKRTKSAAAPTARKQNAVLAEEAQNDLAAQLPASLTVSVDLPDQVHSAPAHEAALSISAAVVDPGLDPASLSTRSISVRGPVVNHDEQDFAHTSVVPRGPERAEELTAERLMSGRKSKKIAPEGAWPAFLYAVSLHLVNLGDSRKVRERKELDARIAKRFEGGPRFVPVLTRKGGVGKTTITAILGMAMSAVREDQVIAIDANPDRGTLAERVNKQTRATVRDAVTKAPSISSFSDFAELVSRDETRLDVLASDTDPMLSEAFDENDYNVVADLASRFYSVILTDCGTGIVHSVMRATLQRADAIVIVSGGSIDEARLASETLTWLEANGYGELVSNAIVAINTGTQGTNLVKLEEIEAHFKSRVREIVRIPYDQHLAAGSVINFNDLAPLTRDAARELAAVVTDGLPVRRND